MKILTVTFLLLLVSCVGPPEQTEDNYAIEFHAYNLSHAKVISDSGLHSLTGFSFDMWVRTVQSPTWPQVLVSKAHDPQLLFGEWSFGIFGDWDRGSYYGPILFMTVADRWGASDTHSVLIGETWNHVVGTMDGMSWRFYCNGVNIGLVDNDALPANTNAGDVYIGGQWTGWEMFFPLHGLMDNVCIYNRALTELEVSANYNSGLGTCSPVANGLVAYWRFDELSGLMLNDRCGTNHAKLLPSGREPRRVAGKVLCNY